MADSTPKSYHTDPTLWLYTSLTAGSSHIITATSRLETILKANKIPFKALDVATDEKARMLWGRRAGKRKLPGLVRMGMVVAVMQQDLEEVEEWNEYGEIKQNLLPSTGPSAYTSTATPTPSTTNTPSKPAPPSTATPSSSLSSSKPPTSLPPSLNNPQPLSASTPALSPQESLTSAMRAASLEAAAKANASKAAALSKKSGLAHTPSTILPPAPAAASQQDPLSKLDSSTLPGTTPPVGTTSAAEDAPPKPKPERTSVHFKGDARTRLPGGAAVPSLAGSAVVEPVAEVEKPLTHRGSMVSMASAEEIRAVEESQKIVEEDEDEEAMAGAVGGKGGEAKDEAVEAGEMEARNGEGPEVKTADATATDEAEGALPGTRTQEQDAARGEKAGESVAD